MYIYTQIQNTNSRRFSLWMKCLCNIFLVCLLLPQAYAEKIGFIVYDGQTYTPEQLERASSSPIVAPTAYSQGSDYLIPRSADGHYYINGAINGFPVVFMIDTGATLTVLPAKYVKNAGIRAGRIIYADTAAGKTRSGLSEGNQLQIGAYRLNDVKIAVQDQLQMPLLGMDVLNRFNISQGNGMLSLKIAR